MMNKRPRQIGTVLTFAVAAFLAGASVVGAEPPPQKIDVSKLKYQESDVVIPNPSEVFAALDKMGSPNWTTVLPPISNVKPVHPPEIAMLLGVVIANGFVAVEAKNKDAVDQIGRKVRDLAAALGIEKVVIAHSNAIINAAKEDNWSTVRTELDRAKSSVRDGMIQLKSKDNSELVSITGWLRGTQALTSLIIADYKPERAELLHQPDLLSTFEHQFEGMDDKLKKNAKVTELREGLKKVRALIPANGNDPIPLKTVEQINAITTELVKSIAP